MEVYGKVHGKVIYRKIIVNNKQNYFKEIKDFVLFYVLLSYFRSYELEMVL